MPSHIILQGYIHAKRKVGEEESDEKNPITG